LYDVVNMNYLAVPLSSDKLRGVKATPCNAASCEELTLVRLWRIENFLVVPDVCHPHGVMERLNQRRHTHYSIIPIEKRK